MSIGRAAGGATPLGLDESFVRHPQGSRCASTLGYIAQRLRRSYTRSAALG